MNHISTAAIVMKESIYKKCGEVPAKYLEILPKSPILMFKCAVSLLCIMYVKALDNKKYAIRISLYFIKLLPRVTCFYLLRC